MASLQDGAEARAILRGDDVTEAPCAPFAAAAEAEAVRVRLAQRAARLGSAEADRSKRP